MFAMEVLGVYMLCCVGDVGCICVVLRVALDGVVLVSLLREACVLCDFD